MRQPLACPRLGGKQRDAVRARNVGQQRVVPARSGAVGVGVVLAENRYVHAFSIEIQEQQVLSQQDKAALDF
jgi:hypothetical protein